MSVFPTTRWTLVQQARADPAARAAALEELCRAYWRPAYAFARRSGLAKEEAEDAVQDFFARALVHDLFARADPARGRLRSLLRTALERHLISRHAHAVALRRGGGVRLVTIDTGIAERELAAAPVSPDAAFEREWALAVIERALLRLEAELGPEPRGRAVLAFFRVEDPPSYDAAAAEAGMTVAALKAALFRARRRFRDLLLEEARGTVAEAGDAEDEVAALLAAVGA